MAESTSKFHSEVKSGDWTDSYIKYNGDVISYDNPSSQHIESWTAGSKNPRWKEQVKLGVQAATDFSGEKVTYSSTPFWISQICVPAPTYTPPPTSTEVRMKVGTSMRLTVPSTPTGLSETKADNRAKELIVRKIRSKQTSFQGGTFLGELARTAQMIRRPATIVRRRLDNVHRVSFRDNLRQLKQMKPQQLLDYAGDAWLTYQLGVAPLLGEIDDFVKTIAENTVGGPQWEVVRAVGEDREVNSRNPSLHHPSSGYPRFEVAKTERSNVSVRYIACIDVGLYATYNFRRMGLAPTNWIPTIWELIPYSFVIDYFSNLGDIISAATLAKSSVRWMLKTVRKERSADYTNWRPVVADSNYLFNYVQGTALPGNHSVTRTHVSRVPYSGSLVPSLTINMPGSSIQYLNIAGLINARRDLKDWFR